MHVLRSQGFAPLHTVGWASQICHGKCDETAIPLCGRREGRNCGVSGVYSCAASRHAKTVQPLVCGAAR
jgi:hypothetical protein